MAIDRKAALAAGYTEEEIDAYEAQQTGTPEVVSVEGEPPPPPPPAPDQGSAAPGVMETAVNVAGVAAPYVMPAALTAGAIYGGSVAKKGFDAMKESAAARTAQANAQMAATQGLQQRFEQREAARAAKAAPGPVAPQVLDSRGQPMRAPATMPPPAAAAPAPQISNARSIVQKLALDKLMPAVGNFASKALPAAQMASGLFYTSPEEIAILKAAEEKKRAQGKR
jgi:hypothetical protein